jgi:iron complex outermembrane recepter protein
MSVSPPVTTGGGRGMMQPNHSEIGAMMAPKRLHWGNSRPVGRACIALLAILLMLIVPEALDAQRGGTLTGRVLTTEGGEPLAGVMITLEPGGHGTITDAAGRYLIVRIPDGSYRVTARRLGRETEERQITIGSGAGVTVDFRLAEQAILMPSVVVSASREAQRLTQTATSVGIVSHAELSRARPTHPGAIMARIPGVWVSPTGGEGHTTAIRQPKTTNPVYLFLEDGVPTRSTGFFNHNALYEVNVPQAERIEVLKGPATALYGSDAIGGVINVETRRPALGSRVEAYAEGGAFGWNRLLTSVSGTRGEDGLRADVNLTRTDGWRNATGYERQSATLRWDRRLPGATLKTVFSASRIDQQTAGASSLLKDDYLDNPRENYTPISYRDVRTARLSTAFERAGEESLVSVTPYLRWNEMRMLPNWSLTFDPAVSESGHHSAGLLVRVRRDLAPLRTRVIAGFDADYSPGHRVEQRVVATRQGGIFTSYETTDLLYDYSVVFRGLSPYVQVESAPLERVRLTAGLRHDILGYSYRSDLDELQTGRHRRPGDTDVSYRHLSPKLGATWEAAREMNLFANYSHGFRAPSEGQLFRQGQAEATVSLRPVTADSREIGARGELLGHLGYAVSIYSMTVENDILTYINPDGTRETQNAGETSHRGLEIGLGATLTPAIRGDVSYTLARHQYVEWRPNPTVDFSGNEMESAPRQMWNVRGTYTPQRHPDASVALEWNRIDGYWMDADNTHRYSGHQIWNLQANVPVSRRFETVLRVTNLGDARFAENAAYTVARGEEFAPGMPRTLSAGLQYRWER